MKSKHPYIIRRFLIIIILLFVVTAILATSCHKEQDPKPTREAIIEWSWDIDRAWAPPKEMVKIEADKSDVNKVIIKLTYMNCSGMFPASFHRARDTIQTRIDIAPHKVRLAGKIFVNTQNGAHLPPIYEPGHGSGMSLEDSIWFTQNGCTVQRLPRGK